MRPSLETIKEAVISTGGKAQAARYLKEKGYQISETAVRRALIDETFSVDLDDSILNDIDVEELIARRVAQYKSKRTKNLAKKTIPITVNIPGPIGIGIQGDPHVDDDGTDLDLVFKHLEFFNGQHPGMVLGGLGDMWNAWSGRLSHLWSEQSTSAAEARVLVKEVISRPNWLFFVLGNHDQFGNHGPWLHEVLDGNVPIVKDWRVRLEIKFPGTKRQLRLYAAHDFPGKSMWSEVFGVQKKALLDGQHDVYMCGDSHTSGYYFGKHPGSEKPFHALQVGSYKMTDRYAEEIMVEDNNMFQCPVILVDPDATNDLDFVKIEFSPEAGADRLAWMRKKAGV